MLKSFSLTHVQYHDGDIIGKLLALVTLSPIYIMVMYATLLATRRDIQTVYVVFGQFINLTINLILKKVISDPRPAACGLDDEGMPSNHSQFIAFFCGIYVIHLIRRCSKLKWYYRFLYATGNFVLAFAVCYSRYYLGYHYPDQIYVGAAIGVLAAVVWDLICSRILCKYISRICSHPVMRWLCVRDYSELSYPPVDEYEAIKVSLSSSKTK